MLSRLSWGSSHFPSSPRQRTAPSLVSVSPLRLSRVQAGHPESWPLPNLDPGDDRWTHSRTGARLGSIVPFAEKREHPRILEPRSEGGQHSCPEAGHLLCRSTNTQETRAGSHGRTNGTKGTDCAEEARKRQNVCVKESSVPVSISRISTLSDVPRVLRYCSRVLRYLPPPQ